MKRIEDKIEEIEKKDKINRLLFVAFVCLLAVGMAYVYTSERRIEKRDITISEQDSTITETQVKLSGTYKELEAAYEKLKRSLTPEGYWETVRRDNSVEGYIAYLTNDSDVDKEAYLDSALIALKSPGVGSSDFQGWLWVASNGVDGYESKDIAEIIYRKDAEDQDLRRSEIHIGDIVKLVTTQNRRIFKDKNLRIENDQGWRKKTKAVVIDTFNVRNNAEFNIKVKFY